MNKLCSALPTLFASTSLLLSSLATFDCTFVKFVSPPTTDSNNEAGLWNYKWWDPNVKEYTCRAYSDDEDMFGYMEVDAYWKAARAFSALTLMFGGFIVGWNVSCFAYGCCCQRHCRNSNNFASSSSSTSASSRRPRLRKCSTGIEGTTYLLCCLCSTLTLLFLKGDACANNTIFNLFGERQCRLSTGAYCTYAAMVGWFVAAWMVMLNEEQSAGIDADGEGDGTTEPLIQDVVFECEQSTYSGSAISGRLEREPEP